jgi:LysM repeat protein
MAQERVTPGVSERRCPNCGTRVARTAESCFMCGYDLRNQPQKRRRLSWVDALLVAAVLGVLIFWWRVGTESSREVGDDNVAQGILPTSVPLLDATPTPTETPTPAPTPTPPPVQSETVLVTHIVEAGETLLSIALQYDVTVEAIQQTNGLADELIRIGDELTIPIVRENSASGSSGPADNFNYTVEEGDTLISISLKFGSTVEDIQSANNLAGNALIRPGDTLVIPVQGVPPEALQPTAAPTVAPQAGVTEPAAVIYPEPRLISPSDGATVARSEAVLLQWASVGVLQPNEWYVLQLLERSPQARPLSTAWTKQTSFRLGAELAPAEGELAEYDWLISVVRVNPTADGQLFLVAASPPSEIRRFVWR